MENPIIDKLRKLIAHEQSARSIGNLAEAETFAAKIQELLTAHKLEMSDVEFEAREVEEPIDFEPVFNAGTNNVNENFYWRVCLANVIAEVNSCQTASSERTKRARYFIGRTSDRELAKILYVYLVELGEELCLAASRREREAQADRFNEVNHIHMPMGLKGMVHPRLTKAFNKWMRNYRDSWKIGYATTLEKRLRSQYATMTAGHTTAMVHIKKDALAVQDFMNHNGAVSGRNVTTKIKNADGYHAGERTGNAMNLSPLRFPKTSGRTSRLLGS